MENFLLNKPPYPLWKVSLWRAHFWIVPGEWRALRCMVVGLDILEGMLAPIDNWLVGAWFEVWFMMVFGVSLRYKEDGKN